MYEADREAAAVTFAGNYARLKSCYRQLHLPRPHYFTSGADFKAFKMAHAGCFQP